MKITVFCNIPMTPKGAGSVYQTSNPSLPVSDKEVLYPVNAVLEKMLNEGDEVRAVLLVKEDKRGDYQSNIDLFKSELERAAEPSSAKISIEVIASEFAEEESIHDDLFQSIVNAIEDQSHLIADITFGPKDLPIVLFSALGFAEKFLNCEIERILYGKVEFVNGKPTDPTVCDMSSLFYLSQATNNMKCPTPGDARKILNIILSDE